MKNGIIVVLRCFCLVAMAIDCETISLSYFLISDTLSDDSSLAI